jgi:hypothetical protein
MCIAQATFRPTRVIAVGLYFILALQTVRGSAPVKIAMTAEHWETTGEVEFVAVEGFPFGILEAKQGNAALKGMLFSNGTIEFDVKLLGHGIPGIRFRQRDLETAEEVYFRPGPDCPASQDCIQYTPLTHGIPLWDIYPEFQTMAPIHAEGWNHIKLVVSGQRMNIFVNGATLPTLAVGKLEGDALEGAIKLHGPGSFANLTVTPVEVDGLSPLPATDPTASDGRYVRNWNVSTPSIMPSIMDPVFKELTGKGPSYVEMPSESQSWKKVQAERKGMINLTREFGSTKTGSVIDFAWLKTTIQSDHDQQKHVAIGWAREIWVYVNGKQVFASRNLYDPPEGRKPPDGRLSLENGSFDLPLRKGLNEISVALDDNFPDGGAHHFGWGLELRLDDLQGVTLSSE